MHIDEGVAADRLMTGQQDGVGVTNHSRAGIAKQVGPQRFL
jgi:hypothetical protein